MRIPFFSNVGTTEALLFMRNLSITLRAGVPLTRALQLFERDAPRMRRSYLGHLRRSVETGHPLADALDTAPRKFPEIAVNLIRVGELGGTLEENLDHIVKYLHKMLDLRRKIRSAMMYPMLVFIAVTGLGLSIATFVLPQLIPLFESLNTELPLSTKILLKVSAFFNEYGTQFVVSLIGMVFIFLIAIRLEVVKPLWHRFLFLIPYVGSIRRHSAIAQIAATLSTLLKSGVHIREAIAAAAGATENRVFRRALLEALPAIETGHTLSDALRHAGRTFPEMTITLVEIGEETGTFAETLEYLSGYYEEEVDYVMKNLTTALEPMLLIGIGLIVGFTVISIITPIYNITSAVQ